MNDYKKKIGIIFLIVVIICLVCIIALYSLNKKNSTLQTEEKVEGENEKVEYTSEKLKDPVKFFSIQACIQENSNQDFTAVDMNILEGDRIFSYSVQGTMKANRIDYFIVRVDTENMTFIIEQQDYHYDNLNQINLETNIQEIKDNGKNTFKYITISEEEICRMYFKHFTELELKDTQKAYSFLDNDYKEERFPTFNEYQEYVQECKDRIENSVLAKYSVDYNKDDIQYVLVDNYNNSYLVKATSVMNYTIKLDNYTIKVENFKDSYTKLEDKEKVQSNVYMFLQMINTKDYKHAYALLDDTFKNNNFNTLQKFKEYVQNSFFPYNLSIFEATCKEEGNYYIYETTIRESSSSVAETKKLTVIMKLEKETDFVMSFSIE